MSNNKAEVRISRRRLQGNRACQIFQKTNISRPLIRTRSYTYQGVRNFRILFPCYLCFEICSLTLLPRIIAYFSLRRKFAIVCILSAYVLFIIIAPYKKMEIKSKLAEYV